MDALKKDRELKERTALGIAGGSILRLKNARGTQVCVERGVLWITQEGDPTDVVVRGGGSLRLNRDGLAIISACGSTALTLVSLKS